MKAPYVNPVDTLQRHAALRPDKTAFIYLDQGETETERATYADLDRGARQVAAYLQSICQPGDRVLLIYPSGLDFIKALYGCLYAGVVPIPTNPPGMNRSAVRLYAIAKDAQAHVALTTPELYQIFQFFQNEYPEIKDIHWITPAQMQADPESWQRPDLKPEGLAFIQYTSGSTNIPRGVVVSYRNLSYNRNVIMGVRGREYNEEGTVIVSWVPLFHDMGLITGIFQSVFDNSLGVLMSPIAFMQKPVRWLRALSQYKGTASGGPNFSYEVCANKITAEECLGLDLSSWKLAFNSAEPVRAETQERFARKFAPYGFEPEAFTPCYGLAEATLLISGYNGAAQTVTSSFQRAELEKGKLSPCEAGDDKACQNLVSCGPPLLDLKVAIANPLTGERSAPDEIGEIWVSGENICEGYWQLPDHTKETFQAQLKDSGEGPFLRTGDLGFMKDGNLYVAGRKKDLIIFRGRNYYPQDIELTVQNSHPLIRPGSGAAFSINANGGERVVIVQEVREKLPEGLTWDDVIKVVRMEIAREHGVRAYCVALIRPGDIPKTSSGKIMRSECKSMFLNGEFKPVAEWRAPV